MFTPIKVYCPICKETMDWMKGYGREVHCCSSECYREFEWRHTLSILGKEYYPDPRKSVKSE